MMLYKQTAAAYVSLSGNNGYKHLQRRLTIVIGPNADYFLDHQSADAGIAGTNTRDRHPCNPCNPSVLFLPAFSLEVRHER